MILLYFRLSKLL